jgi:hypothetical protein
MVLIGMQLLGSGTKLLVTQLADDDLQPAPRLLGRGQSHFRLDQESLQTLVFFPESRKVHTPSRTHKRGKFHSPRRS